MIDNQTSTIAVDQNKNELIHDFKGTTEKSKVNFLPMVMAVVVVFLGVVTGYFIYQSKGKTTTDKSGNLIKGGKVVVGSTDKKSFKDVAEGKLERGGINGDGTHKLIRPGGVNQTVYLTSSIIDLDQYVGKKIRVWGETFAAEKAGWLMDVGRVEPL